MEGPDPHKPCQWRAVNQGAAEGEDPGPGSYWHDGPNRMRSTLTRALISDQTSAADMGGGAAKRSPHHLQLPECDHGGGSGGSGGGGERTAVQSKVTWTLAIAMRDSIS